MDYGIYPDWGLEGSPHQYKAFLLYPGGHVCAGRQHLEQRGTESTVIISSDSPQTAEATGHLTVALKQTHWCKSDFYNKHRQVKLQYNGPKKHLDTLSTLKT